ncbi:MAG: NADAR family protein [Ignavibacterium sp.]|nr:NADAR family protein [Ignavibacterium sp.]
MYPDSSQDLNKETDEAIYFFTPAFHVFDSFSAHRINIWGLTFPTAEHAYHWKKFYISAPDLAQKILLVGSPEAVKQISIKYKDKVSANWHEIKVSVMEEIFRAKAEQHEDVRERLKKTGKKQIIENSPVDSFWGIGPKEDGQNIVGKIWMKIRDESLL